MASRALQRRRRGIRPTFGTGLCSVAERHAARKRYRDTRVTLAIQKRARKGRKRLAQCSLARHLTRGGFHYFARKLAR
jgi:hypothetical protein